MSELREDEVILNEIETSSFELKDGNEEEFYYWIDRFLFREEKLKATLRRIEEAFGHRSKVFREAYLEMQNYYESVKDTGELQVSYEQWKKSLSIAYDSFNDSANNFLIHTYLSIFSKMLAYSVLQNDDFIEDDEIRGILDGSVFYKLQVNNFVENNFFSWITTEKSRVALKNVFRLIAEELAAFDFTEVDEDILKGVYQELIDLDTRHQLGEYYTPDWLCERVVAEYDFKLTDKILDPACGSGSFLRAVIDKLKRDFPDAGIEEINAQVYGIDIHPLSEQIAKTTVLLALGKEVRNAKQPINLNIMLANTLLTPKGVETLFTNQFNMEIDNEKYLLDTQIFDDDNLFDKGLDVCEELAEQTQKQSDVKFESFTNILNTKYKDGDVKKEVAEDFYQIYKGLKKVKENGRDSIWKFIVQNLYRPYFLANKFDYIVGNPPWFTISSIRNEPYQDTLDALAKLYDVKPAKKANYPHLEIAAIFLAYCSGYFLKDGGKIAFVLPRSFFSGDQHENTRSGRAEGFALKQLWDLDKVSPLFRIPSCVLFGEKAETPIKKEDKEASKQLVFNKYTEYGIDGKEFSGLLSVHNCNWNYADELLNEKDQKYYYQKQGGSSAFSNYKRTSNNKPNPYKKQFKNGATIFPQAFYFVDLNQDEPQDFSDERLINIKTSTNLDFKKPWNDFNFQDRVEAKFLFNTALAKSILPFSFYNPNLVVLPVTIEIDESNNKKIKIHSIEELIEKGYLNASRWFSKVDKLWKQKRTEKNKKYSFEEYLNWQNKLTDQNLDIPYLVVYTKSSKDANATVIKREDVQLNFMVENKAFYFATENLNEAYYLTAILNSAAPNKMMKDFQSRGLYGARDVHKKILDIYYPLFDKSNEIHKNLAAFSEKAHLKASEFIASNPPKGNLSPIKLGRYRLDIKEYLKDEMAEIDKSVEKIIG
ncbi:MAG: N-6 DNA methylase [Acidobacteriota bacterium]|nr:N-6 DNA methylase [Acidobacteriota bacterium]